MKRTFLFPLLIALILVSCKEDEVSILEQYAGQYTGVAIEYAFDSTTNSYYSPTDEKRDFRFMVMRIDTTTNTMAFYTGRWYHLKVNDDGSFVSVEKDDIFPYMPPVVTAEEAQPVITGHFYMEYGRRHFQLDEMTTPKKQTYLHYIGDEYRKEDENYK